MLRFLLIGVPAAAVWLVFFYDVVRAIRDCDRWLDKLAVLILFSAASVLYLVAFAALAMTVLG